MDGTEILLTECRNGEYGETDFGCYGFIEKSYADGSDVFGWLSNYGRVDEPTHWMPLPAAPQAEVDSRSRLRRIAAQKGEPAPDFSAAPQAEWPTCPQCNGKGHLDHGPEPVQQGEPCAECGGRGYIAPQAEGGGE